MEKELTAEEKYYEWLKNEINPVKKTLTEFQNLFSQILYDFKDSTNYEEWQDLNGLRHSIKLVFSNISNFINEIISKFENNKKLLEEALNEYYDEEC